MNKASLVEWFVGWRYLIWTLKGDKINVKAIAALTVTPITHWFNSLQGRLYRVFFFLCLMEKMASMSRFG